MLIVLALVVAYAAYEYLPGDDPGNPNVSGDFQSGRPQTTSNQSQPVTQNPAIIGAQSQLTQAGQGTGTFQPPQNLELRDDPFSRPQSLKPVVVETQAQASALTGLTFQGTLATVS